MVNHSLGNIVDDGNVKLAVAQDLSTQVWIGLDAIQTLMIARDKNVIDAAMKRGLGGKQRFLNQREELRRMSMDAESRSLGDAIFETNDKKTQPNFERLIQLVQEGKRDEAGDWLIAKAAPALQELQEVIAEFIEFQTGRNTALREQSMRDFESAKLFLLGSVLASV